MVDFSHLPVTASASAVQALRQKIADWPELQTERLRIRPVSLARENDVRGLADMLGNPRVSGWIYFFRQPFTEVDSYKWIARSESEKEQGTFLMLAVEYAATGTLIGEVHIDFDCARRAADIGGTLDTPYWGKGFAEEGLRRVLDFIFTELELDTVIMTTATANLPAQRVISWLGFPFLREITVLKTDGTPRPTKYSEQTPQGWRNWWAEQDNLPRRRIPSPLTVVKGA